jgi:hypothetical protein
MKNKRILSYVLIVLGAALVINSQTSILGVSLSPPESSVDVGFILGLVFLVIGIGMFFGRTVTKNLRKVPTPTKEPSKELYYRRRVNEIEKDPSDKDYWISQWELPGLRKEFKKRGYNLRGPERDLGGKNSGPSEIRHMKLEGYNRNDAYIRKHLLISRDPYDPRIQRESKTYHPKHVRDYD